MYLVLSRLLLVPSPIKATFTGKAAPVNGYFSTRLHSVYTKPTNVGDESVFRARYPLWYTFTFVCVYGMCLCCFHVNMERK